MSGWDAPTGSRASREEPEESGGPDERGYQPDQPTVGYHAARGGERPLRAGRRGLPGYDKAQSYDQPTDYENGSGYAPGSGYPSGAGYGQGSGYGQQPGFGSGSQSPLSSGPQRSIAPGPQNPASADTQRVIAPGAQAPVGPPPGSAPRRAIGPGPQLPSSEGTRPSWSGTEERQAFHSPQTYGAQQGYGRPIGAQRRGAQSARVPSFPRPRAPGRAGQGPRSGRLSIARKPMEPSKATAARVTAPIRASLSRVPATGRPGPAPIRGTWPIRVTERGQPTARKGPAVNRATGRRPVNRATGRRPRSAGTTARAAPVRTTTARTATARTATARTATARTATARTATAKRATARTATASGATARTATASRHQGRALSCLAVPARPGNPRRSMIIRPRSTRRASRLPLPTTRRAASARTFMTRVRRETCPVRRPRPAAWGPRTTRPRPIRSRDLSRPPPRRAVSPSPPSP